MLELADLISALLLKCFDTKLLYKKISIHLHLNKLDF